MLFKKVVNCPAQVMSVVANVECVYSSNTTIFICRI